MGPKQYQIVWVNLDPTIGSEIKKTRPCVILSPDELNDHLKTIIIAPMTTVSKLYPTRIKIMHNGQEGWVIIDQIRTIDKTRIIQQAGFLTDQEILACKNIMRQTFVD
jgi:mRNA interferase MazF